MSTPKLTIWERWLTFIRFLQILRVVLSEWLAYLIRREPVQEYLYRGVLRLGPTFIKLGQVASTRPDLIPSEISERFKELQENVPPSHLLRRRLSSKLNWERHWTRLLPSLRVNPSHQPRSVRCTSLLYQMGHRWPSKYNALVSRD
jgi:hypothetical protein